MVAAGTKSQGSGSISNFHHGSETHCLEPDQVPAAWAYRLDLQSWISIGSEISRIRIRTKLTPDPEHDGFYLIKGERHDGVILLQCELIIQVLKA
jgi:hypothetical protein